MTFREKLADWISGGELSRVRADRDDVRTGLDNARTASKMKNDRLLDKDCIIVALQSRLTFIADQETPNANATVKRMARIARGEE